MQEGVFITPQEVMEPGLNEALIDYESGFRLKAVKIKLSFPQPIVEEHKHVRDTTHPPKHYGCIYVTRSLYEVTFPMSYRNVGSSCPHYRERRRSPHRTDSDALYAVGGGNTGPASSVTTNFTPNYLDKKYRREDTPGSNSRPNVSEGYEVPLSYRGDRPWKCCFVDANSAVILKALVDSTTSQVHLTNKHHSSCLKDTLRTHY